MKKIDMKYTKTALVSLFLILAGAYMFRMGFKDNNLLLYFIGFLFFAAAYAIYTKYNRKK